MRFNKILFVADLNRWNEAAWQRACALAEQQGDVHTLTDIADTDIPALVRLHNFDLVIKAISGPGNILARTRRWEDFSLMRTCPCPLWLVNEHDQQLDGPILAALDIPLDDGSQTVLNQRILEAASSIALAAFRPLHVVHAWQFVGESLLRGRSSLAAREQVDRILAQEEWRRREWLRRTVREAKSESLRLATEFLDPELHLKKGLAREVVPDLADQLGAQLIVLGSSARQGVANFFAANTSEQILPQTSNSLLIVKAEERDAAPDPRSSVSRTVVPFRTTADWLPRASSIRRRDRLSRQYTKATV